METILSSCSLLLTQEAQISSVLLYPKSAASAVQEIGCLQDETALTCLRLLNRIH